MRIDELTITNFYGFDRRTFNFHPQFTLFAGDNATGKTATLDALAIALGSWFIGLHGPERSPGIDLDDVRTSAYTHLDAWTFEKQFPARIECSGLVLGHQIGWARELKHAGGRTTTSDAKAIIEAAADAERRVRAGEDITLPLICAYGTERLWFEKAHYAPKEDVPHGRRKPSRLDGYRDSFDFTIQETALVSWIRDQTTASLQLQRDTIALSLVKRAITACVENAVSIYYDGRYEDLVVSTAGSGPQLLSNLSDGQRILLTLVGDLAKRIAVLNPHLAHEGLLRTQGVVTIDELDLHLHPKWQRRIIHDLKNTFPSLQFIATTHSPQLIGEARPEEIRLLDGGQTTTPPRSFGIDSSRVLEEVMSTPSRNGAVQKLLDRLFRSIDAEDFDSARNLLSEVEAQLGSDDPEVLRARSLMTFLQSNV
jgi:predicted ATP-binding protein involved in virulence